MTAERHARTKALFLAALERPDHERLLFLEQACGGDAALFAELREMLAVDDRAPGFLAATAEGGALAPSLLAPPPPDRLGPFRVLRPLGEGGMAAVYEAEQERPRRRVALKVLHPGLGTPQLLARFELESEVLGRLQHPGIARIYEAGADDSGRGLQPWFAMELIEGEPLTDHCARRALPLDARLELLAKVADAVHHAHQRGVVHRDLKPGNVLVDSGGQPKVLDFGIALATGGDLPRATLRTDPGMIVGTLQYMSPEQASADPDAIDVRTDVYSLGVMLYELAAGRPPLDLARLPVHEALRRVLADEPAPLRKSARVPADVAVIAHKALLKDKERRYASAAELAADLRRCLRREPISAQPPSRWYRARRFAARNKALVAGAAATFAALALGLATALWQRNAARRALARAEGINRFLLTDLLASPSPERLGRDVRVVDVLGPAARAARRAFAGEPDVAAEVLDAVGASYRALGLIPEAEQAVNGALELLPAGAGRLRLRAQGHLVGVLADLDRAAAAVQLGEQVVAASTAQLGGDDADTLARRIDLANARWDAGQHARCLAELRAAAADQARVLGEQDARTLATQSQLAVDLAADGQIAAAQQMLAQTLAVMDRVLGPEHPSTLGARSNLAWVLTLGSAWQQAQALYDQLLPAFETVYGPDHPYTARLRYEAAQCSLHLGKIDAADRQVRTACADLDRRLGAGHAWSQDAHLVLVEVLWRQNAHDAAIAEAKGIVALRRAGGAASEGLGHALSTLGRSYQEAGDDRQAAATFREAADVFRKAFGKPTDFLAQMLYNLGVATRDAGDAAGAIAPLREALAIDTGLWGADHRHVLADRYNLARALLDAGAPQEAVDQLRTVLASPGAAGLEQERVLGYRLALGQALLALQQDAEAERNLLDAAAGLQALGRGGDAPARRARAALVQLYERQGRADEAARWRAAGR